jgi:hypothetical protein
VYAVLAQWRQRSFLNKLENSGDWPGSAGTASMFNEPNEVCTLLCTRQGSAFIDSQNCDDEGVRNDWNMAVPQEALGMPTLVSFQR